MSMSMSSAEVISRVEHETQIAERDDRIELLEARVAKLQHMLFGRRSEKQVVPPGAQVPSPVS